MNKIFTSALMALLFSSAASAQIVWNFGTTSPSAAPSANSFSYFSVGNVTTNNNVGTVSNPYDNTIPSNYSGASGNYNLGMAANIDGFVTATSAYFQFTITPTNGNSVIVSSLSFGSRSTATGPQAYSIRTSLDGFLTDAGNGLLTNNSTWMAANNMSIAFTGIAGQPVTVRIYGINGTGTVTPGVVNWQIGDLTLNGEALPLKLTSFTASVINTNAVLNWATTNEVNVSGFSVEKSSDGRTFKEISFVNANNRAEANAYSISDILTKDINYYRLKMIDKDGSYNYSKTIALNNKLSGNLSVYPNPAVSTVTVSHPKSTSTGRIQILDMNGRLIQLYNLQPGTTQTTIDVSKIVSGTYIVSFKDASGNNYSTKLNKQ